MADELIFCIGCKTDFTFSEGEQNFYETRGLSKPKRCKPCREKRRQSPPSNRDDHTSEPRYVEQPPRKQWTNGDDSRGNRRNNGNRRRDRGNSDGY